MALPPERRKLILDRLAEYEDERRRGAIDVFEWFCYADPFLRLLGDEPPPREVREQHEEFSRLIGRFFETEAPKLTPARLQTRLDQLARAHARKWDGASLDFFAKLQSSRRGGN